MSHPNFAELITSCQKQLFGYVYSLLGRHNTAWDILQETNLVLWRKKDEFREGTNFEAWAFTVARFQVMAFLRDKKRDPLDVMTPELMEVFAEQPEQEQSQGKQRLSALNLCRNQLKTKSQNLLEMYYEEGLSTEQIGTRLSLSSNAVKQALFRVRRTLQDCIDRSTLKTTCPE